MSQKEQITITGTGNPNSQTLNLEDGQYLKAGDIFVDTANNDVYEYVGDSSWRLIESNIPLHKRNIPSVAIAKSLDDLKKGEVVFITERLANFKVKQQEKTLKLEIDKEGHISHFRSIDYANFTFNIGDKISFDYRIVNINDNYSFTYLLTYNGTSEGIYLLKSGSNYFVKSRIENAIDIIVKDKNGRVKQENIIDTDEWVTIEIEFKTITNTGAYGIDLNTITGEIGEAREIESEIKNLKIKEDIFLIEKFDDSTGELISSDSSKKFSTLIPNDAYSSLIGYVQPNNFQIATDNHFLLELIFDKNIITPQNLGYKENTDLVFENSISPFLQSCIDTGKTVYVGGGYHYYDEPIIFNRNQVVFFQGSDIDADEKVDTDTAYFYTDNGKIDFARIYSNCIINGGVVSFKHIQDIEDYSGIKNPNAYRIVPYGEMYNLQLKDINVVNVRQRLKRAADIGGNGVHLDVGEGGLRSENAEGAGEVEYADKELVGVKYGGVSRCFVSGTFEGLNYAIKIPKRNQSFIDKKGWFNSFTFNIKSHNCKTHIFINDGNIYDIVAEEQDYDCLVDSERKRYANFLNATNITHNIFLYDADIKNSDNKNYWRHNIYNIFSKERNNYAQGKSLIGYEYDFINIPNSNHNTIVRDPERLVLSDHKTNMISKLDNQIRYSGFLPSFSFQGYEMPNDTIIIKGNEVSDWIFVEDNNVEIKGSPSVESMIDENGVSSIQIKPNINTESSAKIDFELTPGATYVLSFDYKVGIGSGQKFKIIGAKEKGVFSRSAGEELREVDIFLGHKDFVRQEYIIEVDSLAEDDEDGTTTVSLIFEAITGNLLDVLDRFTNNISDPSNANQSANSPITINTNFYRGREYKVTLDTPADGANVVFNFIVSDDTSVKGYLEDFRAALRAATNDEWTAIAAGGWGLTILIPANTYTGTTTVAVEPLGNPYFTINVKNIQLIGKWYLNNLYPCHISGDEGNFISPTNDISKVEIRDIDLMKANKLQNWYHLKSERAFVEVFCELQKPGKLRRLIASFNFSSPKLIQGILYDVNQSPITNYIIGEENELLDVGGVYDILPKGYNERNIVVKFICIRFMFPKYNAGVSYIKDLMVATQFNEYDPLITPKGGNIFDNFSSEKGVGNNHKLDDYDVYKEFQDNEKLILSDFKSTIYLNNINSQGEQKQISFNESDLIYHSGKRILIRATLSTTANFAEGISTLSDSNDILIKYGKEGIVTKDKKDIVLKAGDWILVEVMQIFLLEQSNGNKIYRSRLYEITRSNPSFSNSEIQNLITDDLIVNNQLIAKRGIGDAHVWDYKDEGDLDTHPKPWSYYVLKENNLNFRLNDYTSTIFINCDPEQGFEGIPLLAFYDNLLRPLIGQTITIYVTDSSFGSGMPSSKPFLIQSSGINSAGVKFKDNSNEPLLMNPGDWIQIYVGDFWDKKEQFAKLIEINRRDINSYKFINGNYSELPENPVKTTKYFLDEIDAEIQYNGSFWVMNGYRVIGSASERPTGIYVGYKYYDTDSSSVVIWNGTNWN